MLQQVQKNQNESVLCQNFLTLDYMLMLCINFSSNNELGLLKSGPSKLALVMMP